MASNDRQSRDRLLIAAGLVLLASIFTLDLQLPLGAATGMLYVTVVLLGLWSRSIAYPVVAAALATALTMIDLAMEWDPTASFVVYVNRPLMTLTYWVTAVLVVRFRKLEAQATAQLKQLQDLKYAIDQAAIVATTDVTGRITYVNDTFCAISKYSREELLGQDHRIINSAYHPPEFIRTLWRTIASGEVWHGELRNRAKDGSYYWVDTTIVPFLNERGKPYQYTAIRSDITARKSFEAQLREQESLARLGQMAAVVAHEVKNPLAGVKGAVDVIRTRRTAGDPDQPILKEIVSRIDALNDLIQDLLLFARPRPLKPTPLDLRAVIAEIVAGVQRDGAAAQLQMNVDGPECPMVGDRELLRAAFLNLILNAVQAMSGGGRIDVRLTPLGGAFEVAISDSGPGIAPEIRDQVMQPFFTTKTQGGGLGLPIAARSIALHGGSLSLACPPEGGTVVIARVPVKPAAPTAHTAGSALEVR